MSFSRFNAIEIIQNRTEFDFEYRDLPTERIPSFYGKNVFNDAAMKKYMPEAAYLSVKAAIQSGSKLTKEVAQTVADAMKNWALENGATHFAHWFQPLTGRTAEKHDSFFTIKADGTAIEEFQGSALAQQEPDGSSFPGGGLRSTFEARGYTAWDPSSPAFIYETGEGKTLCIPTIFVTYSGEALDYKLPLLKSQKFIEDAAIAVCKYFDENVTKVTTTLGWEQEYFLVDEALYNARPDLVLTGRTLLGKGSPKGQQLEDHYFGSIPERVLFYMRDLETECHKLGIPVRTRHNEVAPAQFELAPMFEEVNVAVDHNQLLMDLMERVARRHRLRVLLHEKPFSGVNGSGKHNNWSLATNTGVNLLSPGNNPGRNLRFLSFFVTTIMAVYEHSELLRASVANAGNDHRLGANEAPPAIVSCFLGETLNNVLDAIENNENVDGFNLKSVLELLEHIPDLEKDNTDRNRTSPFAFTGNKFEIRMVGSSQNCAAPMTIMNTIVGTQLIEFKKEVDQHIAKGKSFEEAILTVIMRYIKVSKPVRFEGDGYSDDWRKEAANRGLPNKTNTPDSLKDLISEKAIKLFLGSGVLSEVELHAHYDVMMHTYNLKLDIESRVVSDLIMNQIMPAALKYQTFLAKSIANLKSADISVVSAAQSGILERLTAHLNNLYAAQMKLKDARKMVNSMNDQFEKAVYFNATIKPLLDEIRTYADKIEYYVEDNSWPLPKYRELLFLR
ncbi:MAG: glutamine synthetase III [Saprospiraceae bacterium]|nr:glutamine synthetase III [Saprospiraceae bacterium]